jgi:hypothetical protein
MSRAMSTSIRKRTPILKWLPGGAAEERAR